MAAAISVARKPRAELWVRGYAMKLAYSPYLSRGLEITWEASAALVIPTYTLDGKGDWALTTSIPEASRVGA